MEGKQETKGRSTETEVGERWGSAVDKSCFPLGAQREKQTTNERQVGGTVKEIFGPNSSADRKRSGRQLGDKWQNKVCGPKEQNHRNKLGKQMGNAWKQVEGTLLDAPTTPMMHQRTRQ